MSKIQSTEKPDSAPVSENLSLTEFCIRLSLKDKRVELISGFEYTERASGHLSDTVENYSSRYAKFLNQPA